MKNRFSSFIIFFLILLSFFSAAKAHAAVLSFSPAIAAHALNQSFTVDVVVSSPAEAVNAFSGDIAYPSDLLSVVSISKTGSIINFWTTESAATKGVVHYEGITLDPGFMGDRGRIIRITFKGIASGVANVKFASASVLLNDGLGTSAIYTTSSGSYTIGSAVEEQAPVDTPERPILLSSTHPDQGSWYQNAKPAMSWVLPAGVTGVGIAIDQNATTFPVVYSLGRTNGYTAGKLADGVWYAHVRYLNANGWGAVAHYRLNIDTTPPTDFTITPKTSGDMNETASLALAAHDAVSGVDHYSLSIDGGTLQIISSVSVWQTPPLPPGKHTITGMVYDKAGNSLAGTALFATTGITAPTIDSYPKELNSGDILTIAGHTYPNAGITISLLDANGNEKKDTVTADASGVFTFTYDSPVQGGNYIISATATIGTYISAPSSSIIVSVRGSLFARLIQFIVQLWYLLVFLCIAITFFIYYRYYRLKKKIREDLSEINGFIQLQIKTLKKARSGGDVKKKQIAFLEELEEGISETKDDVQ
jgi:hypothetical protein